MTVTTDPTDAHKSRQRLFGVVLTILTLGIIAAGIFGAYWIGRNASNRASEDLVKLTVASGSALTLYDVLAADGEQSPEDSAFAALYGVPSGDPQALAARLRQVIYTPAAQPAPFVGHIARPVKTDTLHINGYGFRDERRSYAEKPDRTVRVFITGGSTAWGSGAPSQRDTISHYLEEMLNARTASAGGNRYEVINAAFPAWSTTQEKILIQQIIADLKPDVVIMVSGNNDVHWSLQGEDIRSFFSYADRNFVTMVNGLYDGIGQPEWMTPIAREAAPRSCPALGPVTARNVEEAAFALKGIPARLIFALQPNLMTTTKALTPREQRLMKADGRDYWLSCYGSMIAHLGRSGAGNYQFIDLSRMFGEIDGKTELFIDNYHFAALGNKLVAEALARQIDWSSISPAAR
jgi:lysophospholipase L1-like esterase